MRYRSTAAVLTLALASAACDDAATTPSVDSRLADDVAEVVADAAIEDLAVMESTLPAFGPRAVPGTFGTANLGDRGGLERDREVTFYDATGLEQEAYDEETTASANIVTTVDGEITRESFSASVDRDRDLWVTGLAGAETERTWNGTGESDVSRTRVSDDLGTRSYDMEATSSIDDVVRAVDKETQPWPLSGTITRMVRVEIVNGPNGDEVRERTAILTFNGTQFATLEVDGEVFEVDLEARRDERASRRRGRR